MPPEVSTQETRVLTRMDHSPYVRILRYVWIIFAIVTLGIYVIGFVDFFDVLQRGRPLIDQSTLANEDGNLVIHEPSEKLQALGIVDGDAVLTINGETAMVDAALTDMGTNDSSKMMNFPTQRGLRVNDSLDLTLLRPDGTEYDTVLTMTTANNLVTRSLMQSGLSLEAAMAFTFIIELIYAIGFSSMAFLIFWNRSDDWMAILVATALLLLGLSTGVTSHLDSIVYDDSRLRFFIWVGGIFTYAAFYLFPDGRIVPRWSIIFPIMYLINLFGSYINLASSWAVSFYVISLIGMLGVQFYRYRVTYTRPQRQQAKWALMGVLALVASLIIVASYRMLFRSDAGDVARLYFAISFPLETIFSMALPVGLAFAIMQYRLWDIDVVINRSVVFVGVIIVLIFVFIGAFIISQVVLTQVLNFESSGLSIGISALAVGMTFNPVRQRVQHFIDRNVYHFRFDLNQLEAVAQLQVRNRGVLSETTVGHYKILDLIGRGGMGEVYKAMRDSQFYAIKTLRLDISDDLQAKERFLREAEIQLDHPNIATIVEVGQLDDTHFMVMEFVEGIDIQTHLEEHGTFDVESAIEIVQGICAGLQLAHDKGYVHRDIKPANIMLRLNPDNETYTAVITDFGIAKFNHSDKSLTGTDAIGTIDYMSPEQIQTSHDVDHRADIYALGVVLYEMLTGLKPFGGTPAQILFGHLKQPPPDPLLLKPHLPVYMSLAIMQAMAKDPDDRFRSAAQFAAAIEP